MSLVGTTNRHFHEKILSRLNVGCSTNMTRVLEFESIIFFYFSKEIMIHMRRHMSLSAAYALQRRKNTFEVDA